MSGVRIGLDMVHFAKLKADPVGGKASYEKPSPLRGGIKAAIEHTSDTATLDSDDHVTDIVNNYGGTTVGLDLRSVEPADACLLQGHTLSEAGGVIRSANDTAPYGALLFRSLKTDGTHQYCVLFKGKFAPAGSNAETKKKGGVTFQTPSLKGEFIARDCDGMYEYYVDETPESKTEIAAWFDEVPEPARKAAGGEG